MRIHNVSFFRCPGCGREIELRDAWLTEAVRADRRQESYRTPKPCPFCGAALRIRVASFWPVAIGISGLAVAIFVPLPTGGAPGVIVLSLAATGYLLSRAKMFIVNTGLCRPREAP